MSVKAASFELWMIEAGQKRLKGKEKYTENFSELNTPYLEASYKLMAAITDFSKAEFNTVMK